MNFEDRLAAHAARVGTHLSAALAELPAGPVAEAMAYAAEGGKRLRAFLVIESAALFDIPTERALWPAAAIEAMHAYSLIHDDLPAMDDDDLRRGRPTVHVKWDEATAILAGDALQTMAFELCLRSEAAPAVRADLALSLARAAGAAGMVLGQAQDIAAETGPPLALADITELQRNKTGRLISWSAEAGARLAAAETDALGAYAAALGLAFQIADDILDVTGDAEKAGKALRKDAEAGKATFVSLLGLEGARARARDLVAEAEAALAAFGDRADPLRAAARFVIARDR